MSKFESISLTSIFVAAVMAIQFAIAQEQQPPAEPAPTDTAQPADNENDAAQPAKPAEKKEVPPPPAPNQQPAKKATQPPPPPKPAAGETKQLPAPPKPVPAQAAPQQATRMSFQEQKIQQLANRLRQEAPKQTPQIGTKILDGTVQPRLGETGYDLVLRAEGGTLRDRVALYSLAQTVMQEDNYWSTWLKNSGLVISYTDRPWNADDITVPITPTPEEVSQINQLLQRLQDEIEMDPELHGTYIESADLVGPNIGSGRVLMINGRIIDEAQHPRLQNAAERVAASYDAWQPHRGDVFLSVDDVLVGPVDRDRSHRYFTYGLESFRRCSFASARDAFARALADDPTSAILQYWRILDHIALGEDDRARRKLVPLLVNDPVGSDSPAIATALEHVQGPIRMRLRQLEREVLMTMLP